MKKLLFALITLLLCSVMLSSFTACSMLDSFFKKEEVEEPIIKVEYFIAEGNAVTGLTTAGKKLEHVEIPETINGEEITMIGTKAFYDNQKVKTVKLPQSVTVIGDEAFYGCKNMTEINLSSDVNYLGAWAFYGCSSLKTINIPTEITEIKEHTFRECRSLTNVTFPNTITKIGNKAFEKCIAFTNVHLSVRSTIR